jgi:hypothetical protein
LEEDPMILNIQSNIDFHIDIKMQNEQILEEDNLDGNNVTPEKNEFSSVDSRITVVRYPA